MTYEEFMKQQENIYGDSDDSGNEDAGTALGLNHVNKIEKQSWKEKREEDEDQYRPNMLAQGINTAYMGYRAQMDQNSDNQYITVRDNLRLKAWNEDDFEGGDKKKFGNRKGFGDRPARSGRTPKGDARDGGDIKTGGDATPGAQGGDGKGGDDGAASGSGAEPSHVEALDEDCSSGGTRGKFTAGGHSIPDASGSASGSLLSLLGGAFHITLGGKGGGAGFALEAPCVTCRADVSCAFVTACRCCNVRATQPGK